MDVSNQTSTNLPKREELLFLFVFALPQASKIGEANNIFA